MHQKIEKLLKNKGGNYIFPFFWQHGEDEKTLREYVAKIDEANMKAVCVESRPHPDFCGPRWWHDMDIILDEARKRNMKVWILDDSHFPTGYANGAIEKECAELHRQSIWCRTYEVGGRQTICIPAEELCTTREHPKNIFEQAMGLSFTESEEKDIRMGVYAVRYDKEECIDLSTFAVAHGDFCWEAPEGRWKVYILYLSRNQGYHRNYINMLKFPSCRVLIDAVYEPHFAHYERDFGTTIAGFFSDEPELGNGQLYGTENYLGHDIDFPWSDELGDELKKRLGDSYEKKLVALWDNELNSESVASVRYQYMDAVSRLVQKDFSEQIGIWCRAHQVKYIGHLIEDNDQHARLGSGLGHYFRGLSGQDMAGIDDIGGQVLPQGEDYTVSNGPIDRDGEFYHYMLGHLGASAAAIDKRKNGQSMCEIFGAYGWSEGVQLEKYLIDHFVVRGINHFVPHAFSAKEYPDPDCPPHFYAHGNNPQYRHFGELMRYTNHLCELISDGRHVAPVAVIYHAEAEWMGDCMTSHKVGHALYDQQINFDYVPWDAFWEEDKYGFSIRKGLFTINRQEYRMLLIPRMEYVTGQMMEVLEILHRHQVAVGFIDAYPQSVLLSDQEKPQENRFESYDLVPFGEITNYVRNHRAFELEIVPDNNRIRFYHYEYMDGVHIFLFTNEGTAIYDGEIRMNDERNAEVYAYDAWENEIVFADQTQNGWRMKLEPGKSLVFVAGDKTDKPEHMAKCSAALEQVYTQALPFTKEQWTRSVCRSIEYPDFRDVKRISLPDRLEEEKPLFSGFVAYENSFDCREDEILLEIPEASEGVEVFLNGQSQGIQIISPYCYRFTKERGLVSGNNQVRIEVATTLERENSIYPNYMGVKVESTSKSGIKSIVKLYGRDGKR